MVLTNNNIFKAHRLHNEDIVIICDLVDFGISKSELNALFRNENHPKYIACGDEIF